MNNLTEHDSDEKNDGDGKGNGQDDDSEDEVNPRTKENTVMVESTKTPQKQRNVKKPRTSERPSTKTPQKQSNVMKKPRTSERRKNFIRLPRKANPNRIQNLTQVMQVVGDYKAAREQLNNGCKGPRHAAMEIEEELPKWEAQLAKLWTKKNEKLGLSGLMNDGKRPRSNSEGSDELISSFAKKPREGEAQEEEEDKTKENQEEEKEAREGSEVSEKNDQPADMMQVDGDDNTE
ncbi:expressed unknown protein [Seminavis robusta]|uniref:Uncharacterized protein n=1 Tax=Seminavis robusta TaxID=568900 RepID=A0A9N8EV51_9STRA|nr:expressed unknown protein [Seminavis robusta]|eukprot:Sro1780_g297030.1 n/a (234) ;mRNA; r:13799-14500